jgi:hypothetical protein
MALQEEMLSMIRRDLRIYLYTIGLISGFQTIGCKPLEGQDYRELSVNKSISWEQLKVGQKFRMNPPDQLSKCYLPGQDGLTLGNCGDQEYWVITRAENPFIKQVKSVIDNKCLEFVGGKLKASDCTADAAQPEKNSWGDEDLSPLQKQYLSFQGSSLVPAFRRDCSSVTGSRMRTGGKCKVLADSSKPEGRSNPIEFTVAETASSPGSQLIFRSDVKKAKDESHTGTYASEIRWGHLPRIKAIYVATQGEPFANQADAWITGIQIHYASGEKFMIGNCKLDKGGNCVVSNSDHPQQANPIYLAQDEYLTAVGMKFGQGSMRSDRRNLPHGHDTRLVELMLKTNKSGNNVKLWKGRGEPSAPWQWLSTDAGRMIAGFFGSKAEITWQSQGISTVIHSMGVIYATLDAYRAHNPDAFAPVPKGGKSVEALAVKDGSTMMGINHENAQFRPSLYNYNVRTGQMGPEGVASKNAFDKVFDDSGAKFSSTFYAGSMGNSARTSSLRGYFKNGILVALLVHPEGVSGTVQPEKYGEIPEGASPDFYLELAANEYITEINWKTGIDGAGKIDSHTRAARFSGPTISGMQVKTSKGKIAQFADQKVEGQGWQKGLGRPGYAIVGFHGVFTTESYRDALNTLGILNLGAWIVKTSELP